MASPPHLARVVLTDSEMVKALVVTLVVPACSRDGHCLDHCGLTWPLFSSVWGFHSVHPHTPMLPLKVEMTVYQQVGIIVLKPYRCDHISLYATVGPV